MTYPIGKTSVIEKNDQSPPAASRAVVADGADIVLTVYSGEDGALAAMTLGPHQALDIAHNLLAAARRRFGREVPA